VMSVAYAVATCSVHIVMPGVLKLSPANLDRELAVHCVLGEDMEGFVRSEASTCST
jgi:hypothetical protein